MRKRLTLAIPILLTTAIAVYAQQTPAVSGNLPTNSQVVAELSQSAVKFLDEFEVTYRLPGQMKVIAAVTNYPFADFSVAITISGITPDSITAKVKSYEITNFIVPPIMVTAVMPDGTTNRFLTPPVPVPAVATNTTNQLAPIEDIYVYHNWIWLVWAGAALAAAAGIVLLVLFLIKRRKARLEELANRIDPFEQMQIALDELSRWQVNEKNYKEYFVKISESARRFIERVIEFNALELATSEIKLQMSRKGVSPEIREVVEFILRTCDRVKYAKHIPTGEQIRDSFTESRNLYKLLYEIYRKDEEEQAAKPGTPSDGGEA